MSRFSFTYICVTDERAAVRRNQPMKAIHRPLTMSLVMKMMRIAEEDEDVGEDGAAGGGDLRGAFVIVCQAPDDGAQDAPAVEGEARDAVEDDEDEIDAAQPARRL
jgi:hypothetical protein